jgi:hypothetical protein
MKTLFYPNFGSRNFDFGFKKTLLSDFRTLGTTYLTAISLD